MTKADIMRWAQEAGLKPDGNDWGANVYRKAIEDFADLVAAAEREECAQAASDFLTQGRSPLGQSVAKAIRARTTP